MFDKSLQMGLRDFADGLLELANFTVVTTESIKRFLTALSLPKFTKATDSLWFKLYWGKTNQVRGR